MARRVRKRRNRDRRRSEDGDKRELRGRSVATRRLLGRAHRYYGVPELTDHVISIPGCLRGIRNAGRTTVVRTR